jgi:hypothetical protein
MCPVLDLSPFRTVFEIMHGVGDSLPGSTDTLVEVSTNSSWSFDSEEGGTVTVAEMADTLPCIFSRMKISTVQTLFDSTWVIN